MNPWLADITPPKRENIVVDADFDGLDDNTKQAVTGLLDYSFNTHGYNPAITSGYRDPERNARANGAPNSWHLQRKAVDLDLSGLTPEQIADIEERARGKFSEVLYHDVGSGMHLHVANPIQQPTVMDNVASLFKPSVAEASPAPTGNPWLQDVISSPAPVVASNSSNPWLSDVKPVATEPIKPTATQSEVAGLPALFDEMGNPIINTEGSGLGAVVNAVANPVANVIGTVVEYADKPRGAIAGGVNALIDQTSLTEGIKKGWQENTSWKATLPKEFQDTLAGQVTGLAMDIALDPLWLATPAKAVSIVKRAGKALNADKAVAPIVSALERAKNSEQVQSILQKEIELPGIGKMTVQRALSEEGPLSALQDKLKLDRAKLNEQVAEAGKVLEPISEKGREFVTKGIEATPDNFRVPDFDLARTIKAGERGLPPVDGKKLTQLTFKEVQEMPELSAKIAIKNPDIGVREAYFQELDKALLKGEKLPMNVLAEYSNARPRGIPLTADEADLLSKFKSFEKTSERTYRGAEVGKPVATMPKEWGKTHVQRWEEPGIDVHATADKPQGLYTTPAGVESPHKSLGGKQFFWEKQGKNTLVLDEAEANIRARQVYDGQKIQLSTGNLAYQKLNPTEFELVSKMRSHEVVEYLQKKYPDINFSRYHDGYEAMEAVGATLARKAGFDSLSSTSKRFPEFDEYVALKNSALKKAELPIKQETIPNTEYLAKPVFEKAIAVPYNKAISEKVKELFPEIVKPIPFTNEIPLNKGVVPTLRAGDAEPFKKFLSENLLPWTVNDGAVAGKNLAESRASALVPNRYWEVREAALNELRKDPAFVAKEKQYEAGKSLLAKQEVNQAVNKFSPSIVEKPPKSKVTEEQMYRMMGEGDIATSTTSPLKREEVLAKARLELPPQEAALVENAVDSLSKFGMGRSDELLKREIISQESYDKYYGRYIRREYLKHENPVDFAKQLRETGNVAEAEKLEKTLDAVGNSYQKRSGIKMQWDDIKQRQNLSEAEQEALGRIMDATHPFAKGGAVSSDLIAKYDFLDAVKTQFGNATEMPGYRLIEGKGFGPLEGTWVPKDVFNEVTNTVKSLSPTDDMWRKGISTWKTWKTILNPAGHARNFMSNAILLDMAGIPTAKVPVYLTRAGKEMLEKGKYYKEIKENTTIMLDTFKQIEALQLDKPGLYKTVVDKAGDIYQGNEVLGKTAAYIFAREKGMDIAQAAKFAQDALFDYSKVPPVIDYLRRNGMVPFASFPYFATKATAKTLYKDPMTVLKYYKPQVAGKTEEQKAQEKLYPKWMQPQNYIPLGKSTRMRNGKEETVDQFLDTSFIFPFDNDVSISPAFTLAASLATNTNWLTGGDIARKGSLPADKAEAYFKYAAQQILPSLAPYGYSSEKLMNAFQGTMDKQGRQYTPTEAVAHTIFGLKNVPINTDEVAKQALQGIRRDRADIASTMRDIMRDKRLTQAQREQKIREYQVYLKDLSQRAQALQSAYKKAKGKELE